MFRVAVAGVKGNRFSEQGWRIITVEITHLTSIQSSSINLEFVNVALPMVLIAALFQIPDGLQGIANSILRGLNDTRIPALLAISSFWLFGVGGGALLGFTFDFGPVGVWSGLLVGLATSALALTWRMQRSIHRLQAGGRILSG